MTTPDSNLHPMTPAQWSHACCQALDNGPSGTWAHVTDPDRDCRINRAAELVRLHWLGMAQPTRSAIPDLQALFAYVTSYAARHHVRAVAAASPTPGERFDLDADE